MGRPKGSVNKPKGVGDVVEKVAKKTGVKKVVEKAFKDCGCTQRKEWLNLKFPFYNRVKECMTEEQYQAYDDFKSRNPKTLNEKDQNLIHNLYCSIFAVNVKPCRGCNASQWKQFIRRLDNVYKAYQNGKDTKKAS